MALGELEVIQDWTLEKNEVSRKVDRMPAKAPVAELTKVIQDYHLI